MMPQLDFWAVGAFLAVMALLATLRQSLPFAAAQRAGGVIGFLTSPIWLVPLILAMAGVIGLMLTGAVSPWPPQAQAEFSGQFGAWAGITGFILVVVVDLWLVWTPSTETVSPRPAVGSQPSSTAKSRISIMPFQKLGSEKPRMVLPMMMREGRLSGSSPA